MASIELNAHLFNQTIQENSIVFVDFWASWCGPCKAFAPIYEAASIKHEDIVFAKVNTEAEQELAQSFNIRSIPTLMVFRDQVLLYAEAGALSPVQMEQLIKDIRAVDMDDIRRQIEEQEISGG
jgi:thioredoxin 1